MSDLILITGSAGFIGSNLCHLLQKEGRDFIHLDALFPEANINNLDGIKQPLIRCDLVNELEIASVFAEYPITHIIHLAASSHVDRSITDDTPFWRSNVIGTANLARTALRSGKISKFINQCCYDEETLIVTKEGLKKHTDIKVGDLVLSISLAGNVEEKEVLEIIEQDYEGEMIRFFKKNRGSIDLLVTPNHWMYYQESKNSISRISAEDLINQSERFSLPQGLSKGKEEETIFIEEIGEVRTEDLFYLSGVFLGNGFLAAQTQKFITKSGLSKKDYSNSRDPETGRFRKIEPVVERIGSTICSRIFFDIPENDKARKATEEVLTRLGIKWSAHKGKAGEHLYFSSRAWSKFFSQFKQGAANKEIPLWMLKYGSKYLEFLFKGLVDSDGCYIAGLWYSICSRKLAEQVCFLSLMLGLQPKVRIIASQSSQFQGRIIKSTKPSYVIHFCKSYKYLEAKDGKRVSYKGKIWCLRVADNKNLAVYRNGFVGFCGNTDEILGEIPVGIPAAKEGDVLRPTSPYACSKAGQYFVGKSFRNTYGLPIISTFPVNNYGPRQNIEKLIPKFITKLIRGEKIPLMASTHFQRDWLPVDDMCRALLLLLDKGIPGEDYNIGADNHKTNEQLTIELLKLFNKTWEESVLIIPDRKSHDCRYAVNSDKIKLLGWEVTHAFLDYLEYTISWFRSDIKVKL